MSENRYRVEIALLASGNVAVLLGFLLYYFTGIWTLAVGLGCAFIVAVLVYRLSHVRRALKRYEHTELFAVYRQAFELLDLYLKQGNEEDDRQFFRELLQKTLTLTGAEFGFVGTALQDEAGKPFLRTRWISDIAWNEASRAAYSAQGMEFTNLDSLFGYTLRTGDHLITNKPGEHSEAGGFPSGHPIVKSYMGVPLKSRGELIGMIGLGNRPGGFELNNLRLWQPFFDICSQVLEHHKLRTITDLDHQQYRQLFEEAPLMYIVTESRRDAIGNFSPIITDCNTCFADRLGFSKKEVIGRRLVDFYDRVSVQALLNGGYDQALHDGILEEPRVLIDCNGQHIQTILKAVPITGERGLVTGTRAMFLDVSALYAAHERNRSLEVSVRRLLVSAKALIVEFDRDLLTLSMSAGMQRLLRFNRSDGEPPDFLRLVIDDEDRERLQSALKRVLRKEPSQAYNESPIEIAVRSKFGDRISLLVILDVHSTKDGSTSVWLAAQDVSESQTNAKLAAEALRAEGLEKLTGSIAHEFNNLITVISRNITVLQSSSAAGDEEREVATEDIHSAIRDTFVLTQTLLAYSGQQVLRPSSVFLENVLAALVQRMRVRIGLQPAISLVNEAKGHFCRIDEGKLEDIVWHIVENAVEACKIDSTIEIHVKKVELTILDRGVFNELTPGDYLLLSVRDSGEGINESVLSRVQDPFFSTRRKRGLGLSNARGLLKQSGGTVIIESAVGVGTNVGVWLPDEHRKARASKMLPELTERISRLRGTVGLFLGSEDLAHQIFTLLSTSSVELLRLSAEIDLQAEIELDLVLLDTRIELTSAERLVSGLGTSVRVVVLEHALSLWPETCGDRTLEDAERVHFPVTTLNVLDVLEKALLP
ncbi:MAG: ATP-binding protein [Proteobacteria bacterium]|nr:ATP-binding protein [Pseudomonadota bacterium]